MAREHALVPEVVIAMPKQSPSDSPIDRWYTGPLRGVVDELLAGLPFEYDRAWVNEVLTPKWAEEQFAGACRSRITRIKPLGSCAPTRPSPAAPDETCRRDERRR